MTNRDIEIMLHFITKTEMFIRKDQAALIVSFVTGYETGSNGACDFSNQISELLEQKFHCEKLALGWPGQITEFGKKENLNWKTTFKKIGLQVLSKYFHGESKEKFRDIVKVTIQTKINQIEIVTIQNQKGKINRFGKKWINKWIGLIALEEKWFQEMWTNRELTILSNLDKEISMIENKDQKEIVANKNILQIMNEFKKEAIF